jgi:hypothetical protein
MIIPGLMILIALIAVKESDWKSLSKEIAGIEISQESFQFYVVPLIFGAIYYLSNLRNVFFKKPIQRVVDNIYTRLLKPFEDHSELRSSVDGLNKGPAVKQIFYRLIDSEPDLKEKANNVRMNGLVLSSFADAAVICLIFFPIYLGFYIVESVHYYLVLSIIVGIFFLLARFVLLPRATTKQLRYSNEQIDSILSNYFTKLEQALINAVRQNVAE